MQIGAGGVSSDTNDKLRCYVPDPSLGPHDPTTAVELAAVYLIKFAGAPTGQPIDAYRAAVLDYNHDPAYVDRVLADADVEHRSRLDRAGSSLGIRPGCDQRNTRWPAAAARTCNTGPGWRRAATRKCELEARAGRSA
jgi:hypothetical protein